MFSEDVLPVIRESFLPLLTQDTGIDASSWSALLRGSDQGELLIPYDADRSLLIERALEAGPDGPSEEERNVVRHWIDAGAPDDDGRVAFADADELLYVCNQASAVISIVDMATNVVIRTVDLRELGFSENANPHHIAVAPDGEHWYVSLIGEHVVLKFTRENELVGRAAFDVPGMLSISSNGESLYVGRSMSAVNPPQRIGRIDVSDMSVEEIDVFYSRPHALIAAPGERHVYSASLGVNQIASIDPETLDIELTDVGGSHHGFVQFAAAPNRSLMIAGGEMSGQLLFFSLEQPMSPKVVKVLDVGGAPWHPSFLPDGSRALVPRKRADAVTFVDVATLSASGVVSGRGLAQPHGSTVRTDGRYAYVSNNNLNGAFEPRYETEGDPHGTVAVIDTQTLEIVKILEVEQYPTGIGSRPPR